MPHRHLTFQMRPRNKAPDIKEIKLMTEFLTAIYLRLSRNVFLATVFFSFAFCFVRGCLCQSLRSNFANEKLNCQRVAKR